MTSQEQLNAAREQLRMVLDFFGRVETKPSVVLGVDLAMLGFLASKIPTAAHVPTAGWIAAGVFAFLNGGSLWNLYRASAPQLEGGHDSLVYFREIAKRTEVGFVDEFRRLTEDALAKDVLGQVWRNSQILRIKFDCLVLAYRFMAVSIAAWVVALVIVTP